MFGVGLGGQQTVQFLKKITKKQCILVKESRFSTHNLWAYGFWGDKAHVADNVGFNLVTVNGSAATKDK